MGSKIKLIRKFAAKKKELTRLYFIISVMWKTCRREKKRTYLSISKNNKLFRLAIREWTELHNQGALLSGAIFKRSLVFSFIDDLPFIFVSKSTVAYLFTIQTVKEITKQESKNHCY